jgi:predicted metal-dependent hydrolase
MAVRVFHTGRVEVVVPARTPPRAIESFLARHRTWIERKREEARLKAVPPVPFPPQRIELAACGELWRLHLAGGPGRARVAPGGGGLLVLCGDAGDRRAVREALRCWLMQRARQILSPWLSECARELGFEYRRVAVRRQRTRWGSCSTRGTISLNCCLLFQPAAVVRYLMIHELAHTRHMNHSRQFWQCVAQHCPQYRRLDQQLLEGWRVVPSWVSGEQGG